MRLSTAVILFVAFASPAVAQSTPDVHVPPLEFTAGVSIEHKNAGAVASIAGNLTRNVAVLGEACQSSDGTSLLAGARVGTSFYYDGRPPVPGRFFVQIMAGRSIVQPGAGADVVILPHAGISLHWSVDYRWIHGGAPDRSGARLVVGILVGPRT
jgi:hypothetical protein